MIYFDNAATTAPAPEVIKIIDHILKDEWGNPSSLHKKGFEAEKTLRKGREYIASSLGVRPDTISFLSSASEANNMVFNSLIRGKEKGEKKNIIISRAEHASVYEPAQLMEKWGYEVRYLPLDRHGNYILKDLEPLLDEKTDLVFLIHVNNELGSISEIKKIGKIVRQKAPNALYAIDGTQALGKFDLDLGDLGVDIYTASGHKIHAPKGIGILYLRQDLKLKPMIVGGGQEAGLRSGTENVAFAAGMAEALKLMDRAREGGLYKRISQIRERAIELAKEIGDVKINSDPEGSPYILNIGIGGIKSEVLLHFMEMEDMYLSSGSACSKGKASRVLAAINVEDEFIDGSVRLSFSRFNNIDQLDRFFKRLSQSVKAIREVNR